MLTKLNEPIVILGMSDNPERYSYIAHNALQNNGFQNIIGITPRSISIKGVEVLSHISEVKNSIHTLTLYTNPEISNLMVDDILKLSPKRIIMNPGSENYNLKDKAELAGIEVVEGCTLVMLSTSQF